MFQTSALQCNTLSRNRFRLSSGERVPEIRPCPLPSEFCPMDDSLIQRCTNPWLQVTMEIKFYMVTLNVYFESSVWNLSHIFFLALLIWRCLLGIMKNCGLLLQLADTDCCSVVHNSSFYQAQFTTYPSPPTFHLRFSCHSITVGTQCETCSMSLFIRL